MTVEQDGRRPSPLDTVWAVGLGAKNERATDPVRWRGRHLLGFALVETRDEIARVWAHADLVLPEGRHPAIGSPPGRRQMSMSS